MRFFQMKHRQILQIHGFYRVGVLVVGLPQCAPPQTGDYRPEWRAMMAAHALEARTSTRTHDMISVYGLSRFKKWRI